MCNCAAGIQRSLRLCHALGFLPSTFFGLRPFEAVQPLLAIDVVAVKGVVALGTAHAAVGGITVAPGGQYLMQR